MFDFLLCSDQSSMLRGMKGYKLTQSDLEFIEKMKTEKLIKQLQVIFDFFSHWLVTIMFFCLITIIVVWFVMGCFDCPQGELEEGQRLLNKEIMSLELACFSRDKAQAELKKVSRNHTFHTKCFTEKVLYVKNTKDKKSNNWTIWDICTRENVIR